MFKILKKTQFSETVFEFRVEVGGKTKFACVDGPDFDATQVDWDDLGHRQATYRAEEAVAVKHHEEDCACHQK